MLGTLPQPIWRIALIKTSCPTRVGTLGTPASARQAMRKAREGCLAATKPVTALWRTDKLPTPAIANLGGSRTTHVTQTSAAAGTWRRAVIWLKQYLANQVSPRKIDYSIIDSFPAVLDILPVFQPETDLQEPDLSNLPIFLNCN